MKIASGSRADGSRDPPKHAIGSTTGRFTSPGCRSRSRARSSNRALDRADGLACHAANGRRAAVATATVRDGDSPAPRRREAEESFVHRGLGLLDSVSWRARRVDDGS